MDQAPTPEVSTPRSRVQRLLLGLNAGVLLGGCALVAGTGWLGWRLQWVDHIQLDPDVVADEVAGEPMNYVLVGSDTREGLETEGFGGTEASSGEGQADSIILVRIDPQAGTASMVSFPRDLWVEFPGRPSNRINTALLRGPTSSSGRCATTSASRCTATSRSTSTACRAWSTRSEA